MSPPLRTQADCEALINALADGTIDAIASDHAPHDLDSKEKEFVEAAFGILGLQSSLSLVLELIEMGRLTKTRAVEVMTSGPAKALGLPYGSLSIGACADLVIVDPEAKWRYEKDVIMSISKNSPFIGREMKGVAKTVIVGGDIKMQNGELIEGHEL